MSWDLVLGAVCGGLAWWGGYYCGRIDGGRTTAPRDLGGPDGD